MANAASRPAHPHPVLSGPQLYALVDLARAPQLLPLIHALGRSGAAQCLFEGAIAEPLRRVSPYIVALGRAPQLLDRWLAEGRGQSWGVFLKTPLSMHLARRHVRRFLQVKLPDGSGPLLMRFWDPRVLGLLLEHAEVEQRPALFRDDIQYLIEQSDSHEDLRVLSAGHQTSVSWNELMNECRQGWNEISHAL